MPSDKGFAFSFSYKRRSPGDDPEVGKFQETAPPGAISAPRARIMEQVFIDRTRENIENVGSLYNPLDGEEHPLFFEKSAYQLHGDRSIIKEILEHYEIFDKTIYDKVPENKRFEYVVSRRGVFSSKPKVKVCGIYLSHLEGLITRGHTDVKVPLDELELARERYAGDGKLFTYIAVFSPTGFDEACYASLPDGPSWELVLIEPVPGGSNKITSREESLKKWVNGLFDLETPEEKQYRIKKYLEDSADLARPGGFLVIADAADELALPEPAVMEAFGKAAEADDTLAVENVGGRDIIKRARI